MVIVLRVLAAHGGYLSIFDAKYHQDVSVKGFWLSLFLVHAWNSMDTLTWNGVSWFVSVEFALCLLFPVFAVAGGRRTVARLCPDRGGLWDLWRCCSPPARPGHHLSQWRAARPCRISPSAWAWRCFSGGLKPRDRLPALCHSLIQLLLLGLAGVGD